MDIAGYSLKKTVVEREDEMFQALESLRVMTVMNAVAHFEDAYPGGIFDFKDSIRMKSTRMKRMPAERLIVRAAEIVGRCTQGNDDVIQVVNNIEVRATISQNTAPVFICAQHGHWRTWIASRNISTF
jgi:hypothetical protein